MNEIDIQVRVEHASRPGNTHGSGLNLSRIDDASMRPGHEGPGIPDERAGKKQGARASMRPGHEGPGILPARKSRIRELNSPFPRAVPSTGRPDRRSGPFRQSYDIKQQIKSNSLRSRERCRRFRRRRSARERFAAYRESGQITTARRSIGEKALPKLSTASSTSSAGPRSRMSTWS